MAALPYRGKLWAVLHRVMISRREQEDGLLNLSYQRGHPDAYNLEHTTAFN